MIISEDGPITWSLLIRHLMIIGLGLLMTTVPVVTWMIPRLADQLGGLSALHAVLGLQAYAMLAFALTGIVRIFQVKRRHDLYADPDEELELDTLHENMPDWRRRLRMGVAGYVLFWIAAWFVGIGRYLTMYGYL